MITTMVNLFLLASTPARHMRSFRRIRCLSPIILAVLWLISAPAAAEPEGTLTIGMHFTPVTRWLDPAEGESTITPYFLLYALHDALLKPMPGVASGPSLAESWSMSRDMLSAQRPKERRRRPRMLLTGPVALDIRRTPGTQLTVDWRRNSSGRHVRGEGQFNLVRRRRQAGAMAKATQTWKYESSNIFSGQGTFQAGCMAFCEPAYREDHQL
jgi:hypothetical protein